MKKKKKYIKPKFKLEKEMTFMFAGIKKFDRLCRQCSGCHGCR